MDNESKFWIITNIIIGIVIISFTFITANYWTDHNKKIVDLIGAGVDPVAAMCAFQDDYGDHPTCIILATKK